MNGSAKGKDVKGFIKAGRQFIKTPLVAGSGSRMIRQSFNAILGGVTFDKTTIVAGQVTEFQNRTDKNGRVGAFDEVGANATKATTVYLKNNSIENLTIQAQIAEVHATSDTNTSYNSASDKVTSLNYIDAKYSFGAFYGAAQYYKTSYTNDESKAGNHLVGAKFGGKFGDVKAYAAYSQTGKSDDLTAGVDTGLGSATAANIYTASTINRSSGASLNDTKVITAAVTYDATKTLGVKAGILYATIDAFGSLKIADHDDLEFLAQYKTGNWTTRVDYALIKYAKEAGNKQNSEMRAKLTYSF
jgi:hypothetical protein